MSGKPDQSGKRPGRIKAILGQATRKEKKGNTASSKEEITRQILDQAKKVRQSFQRDDSSGKQTSRPLSTPHAAFQPYAAFGSSGTRERTPAETLGNLQSQSLAILQGQQQHSFDDRPLEPTPLWAMSSLNRRASDSIGFKSLSYDASSKRRRRSAGDAYIDENQALQMHQQGLPSTEEDKGVTEAEVVTSTNLSSMEEMKATPSQDQQKELSARDERSLKIEVGNSQLGDLETLAKKDSDVSGIRKFSLHEQIQATRGPEITVEPIVLNSPPYEQIILNNNDVVCTDGLVGTAAESLIGNRRFKVLLDLHHSAYVKAKTPQLRTTVARTIVQSIHHAVPQGRFLTVDPQGIWAVNPPLWSIYYVERSLAARSAPSNKPKSAKTA